MIKLINPVIQLLMVIGKLMQISTRRNHQSKLYFFDNHFIALRMAVPKFFLH